MITEEQYQQIKSACLAAREAGVKIVRSDFGVMECDDGTYRLPEVNPRACAIGCVLIGQRRTSGGAVSEIAAAVLGGNTTRADIWDFINGFDNCFADPSPVVVLGQRLATELGF